MNIETSTGILAFLYLVHVIAGRFRARFPEIEYQELVGEGSLALMMAVKRILQGNVRNPKSYIFRCVQNSLTQYVRKEGLITLKGKKIYPKMDFFSELDDLPDSSIL